MHKMQLREIKSFNDLGIESVGLFALCKKFIDDNKITCSKDVYNFDLTEKNSYDFIKQICDMVGYSPAEGEDA